MPEPTIDSQEDSPGGLERVRKFLSSALGGATLVAGQENLHLSSDEIAALIASIQRPQPESLNLEQAAVFLGIPLQSVIRLLREGSLSYADHNETTLLRRELTDFKKQRRIQREKALRQMAIDDADLMDIPDLDFPTTR